MGFRWHGIRGSRDGTEHAIVFVKDNKVVCYCNGLDADEIYSLYCRMDTGMTHRVFYAEERPVFEIRRFDFGDVILEYVE